MSAVHAIAPVQDDLVAPSLAIPRQFRAEGTQGGVPVFGDLLGKGLAEVNDKLLVSQTDLQRLATGDTQNLHQVMIRLEESRLSLQLMMQVRSRLLEAYQDVMKMQI